MFGSFNIICSKSNYVRLGRIFCILFIFFLGLSNSVYSEDLVSDNIEEKTKVYLEEILVELYKPEEEIREFYTQRSFDPFWLKSKGIILDLIASLKEAHKHGLPSSRYPLDELESIHSQVDPSQLAKLELLATEAFMLFARDISTGILVPNMIDENINIYPTRVDAKIILANLKSNLNIEKYFNNMAPKDPDYQSLVNELENIKNVSLKSLWGNPVPTDVVLAFGITHENVVKLRSRLNKMGYPVEDNGSMVFDRQVESAAKRFQEYHGLNPDGVFGKRSLEAANVHPNTRAIQILVNLERLRWNNRPREREYILVNQPNFEAFFEKNGEKVWESRVVIGLPSNQTAEFNDFMTHIIINPTWHVPKSIAVDEYLPMIQNDPNFLSDNDMRLMVRGTNKVIDSTLIDMQAFTPDNFPFLIKQNPSNINALGLVKFMFPNKFSIYMHDTPMKDLFFKDERTFSHGCIRLQEPFEFAYSLLRDQTENPEKEFQEILTKTQETQLNLNRDIPVKIIYRTAFFDKFGQVQFRSDIYGRDALVFMALSEAGVKIF